MRRAVGWYVVGSLVLLAVAGCVRGWFAEREPWRREAEVQCLQSGAVKEGPAVAVLPPIRGPGACGADYPLKVAALGENTILGYSDDPPRPPGNVPQFSTYSRPPPAAPHSHGVARSPLPPVPGHPGGAAREPHERSMRSAAFPPSAAFTDAPLSLAPPGIEPPPAEVPGSYAPPIATYAPPRYSRPDRPYPASFPPNGETVPLGPTRDPPITGSLGPAALAPPATLACPVVSTLDRWVAEAVQPSAQRWFGQPVAQIKQISAYSCRGMNGNPNAHISEHAFGNALDIAGFVLADGRTISIRGGWRGSPEEQGFLHDVQGAACSYFNTVLAPGSNRYHYDHIHVDLMRRPGGRRICEPAAIAGDMAAARARERAGYAARPADPAFTGATAAVRGRARSARLRAPQFDDGLPRAVAGED
jgi:hypothetical protein